MTTTSRWLLRSLLLLAGLAALGTAAGQLHWLAGQPPDDLGVVDGRLKPPSVTPNSVSSQAQLHAGHPRQLAAQIDPLPLRPADDLPAALARLRSAVEALPGAVVVTQRGTYLYARCTSRWLGFVDDLELLAEPGAGLVQVRSASRLGLSDLGVNRARVEQLRAWLEAAPTAP